VFVGAGLVAACATHDSLTLGFGTPTPTSTGSSTPTGTPTPVPSLTPIGYGDGHNGNFAPVADTTVNVCTRVLLGSNLQITVESSTSLTAGKYLVLQVQDDFGADPDLAPLSATGNAGLWEIARVASIAATTLTLQVPLNHRYDSSGSHAAQACLMPEYLDVTLDNVNLLASNWDGKSGGVIAFFATGDLSNNAGGRINASGAGFRGGVLNVNGGATSGHLTAEDTANNDGGGKGESADGRAYAKYGRGNYANGGGGGDDHDSGGGGGAGGGAGGFGGQGAVGVAGFTPNSKGRPGQPIAISASQRLFFGGGGGSGHQTDSIGTAGANGGGLILIFANTVTGSGTFDANAQDAATSGNIAAAPQDGAGGGGGGGTVSIFSASGAFTGTISVKGGKGGQTDASSTNDHGPGGGGGGGRIYAPNVAGTVVLTGGANGINGLSGSANLATSGSAGVKE
jgi:hypothetical protein